MRDRLGEAKEALATDEPEIRLSVWLYDPNTDRIDFYYSNEIDDDATKTQSFERGEGMVGQAFVEQRTWNEPNALQLASYIPIVQRPKYKAVYCGPISFYGDPKGMLCMDKNEESYFGGRADAIARSLADVIAAIVKEYDRAPIPKATGEQ